MNISGLQRSVTEFKMGYQHKINFVNNERGDLLADSQTLNI
jgi:hypothetical protein